MLPISSDAVREARALGELAELRRDPVYAGRGVPRGDGRLVLVVPALLAGDLSLLPLRAWLDRLGYTALRSGLVANAGCPDRLRGEVERRLRRELDRRPGPVALIGHSRGGMLAWALATRLGPVASHLVLLGSPAAANAASFRHGDAPPSGTVAAPAVEAIGRLSRRLVDPGCNVPDCGCPYPQDLQQPFDPATRVLSVYSRDDRVVSPEACRVESGRNVEVGGTHSGLGANREVYPVLARFLADADADGAGGRGGEAGGAG